MTPIPKPPYPDPDQESPPFGQDAYNEWLTDRLFGDPLHVPEVEPDDPPRSFLLVYVVAALGVALLIAFLILSKR